MNHLCEIALGTGIWAALILWLGFQRLMGADTSYVGLDACITPIIQLSLLPCYTHTTLCMHLSFAGMSFTLFSFRSFLSFHSSLIARHSIDSCWSLVVWGFFICLLSVMHYYYLSIYICVVESSKLGFDYYWQD